jgi:hypothetical protein
MRASIDVDAQRPIAIAGERILHPAMLVAMGTLIVNDHVLKGLYPGLLTGKLSDVAGLLFFPVFLQGLWELGLSCRRRAWQRSDRVLHVCAVLTGAVFAFVKLSALGAALYRSTLGALHGLPTALVDFVRGEAPRLPLAKLTQDPSDVWALPAIWVGLWLVRRPVRTHVAVLLSTGVITLATKTVSAQDARAPAPQAHAQVRENPSRPGRPARPVGFYMRGGLGMGIESAHVRSEIETTSTTGRAIGQLEESYRGFDIAADAMGAVRLRRGLVGVAFVGGHATLSPTTSDEAQALALEPAAGLDWYLLGPMGGAQLGRDATWVIGGMFGWGKIQTRGFSSNEGAEVDSSRVYNSTMGLSAWGGPAWPLGRGWMLGPHLRFTMLISDLELLGAPDVLTELAVLVDVSFQSP